MAGETNLHGTVARLAARIATVGSAALGEQDTKAGLIEPLLRALGWDTEDWREVRREFRFRPSDNPVDYALTIDDRPSVFVEAKALRRDFSDRKHLQQVMTYAALSGVEWVVLTDGDHYRFYNAHAAVPIEQKLFDLCVSGMWRKLA